MRRYLAKIFFISLVIIIVAMAMEVAILVNVNRANAYRMTDVLLNQVVDIVHTNQRNAEDLLESVKDDYKIRAQSVSYILDLNPSAEFNIDELKNIARLLSIDEIHLFDTTGKIYAGTVPKYYGYSMDSGEQMSFFKPMLTDKSLSMCQDVTPNTAESKSMMYAMCWDKSGNKLVQIGIEPFRLIEVMKRTQLSEIMAAIPTYDGIRMFVADAKTQNILGTNNESAEYKNLSEIDFPKFEKPVLGTVHKILRFSDKSESSLNKKHYSSIRCAEDYIFCVAFDSNANVKRVGLTMWIIFIYLFIAAVCITFTIIDRARATEEKMVQYNVLLSMSKIYYSMHLINLKQNSVTEYSSNEHLRKITNSYKKADVMMKRIMSESVSEDFKERMLQFTDLNTLAERLTGKKIITEDFIGVSKNWFRASFITISARRSSVPESVIFTIQNIEEEKNKEAVLVHKSTTDELTGCLNRRAYQEELKILNHNEDFVYISFDLNELKNTNDTAGHEGGDELIIAAADIMKECFANYGNIYRTGGDEFVGILYTNKETLENQLEHFDDLLNSWTGKLVKSISISYGYVFSNEINWKVIHEIEKEADNRLYECKAVYYQKSGVDRRSNQKAYFAASVLYAKILKINLTNDSYRIVNIDKIDKNELTSKNGYKDSISGWLKGFAETGQVFDDDKENYLKNTDLNYLRNYFMSGKKLLSISYRRKINEEFKQVLMEIIPTEDYSENNQECYLYVKKLEN